MNKKQGLDYFPFDITFFTDDKIRFMSALYGTKGESITVRLLCRIYREGYFLKWDDDVALLFAADVGDGCKPAFVNEVIGELAKRGFFDQEKYEKYSVLTSKGIQKRFFEAAGRRKAVLYDPNIVLINMKVFTNVIEDDAFTPENVDILKEDVSSLKQSKGKERKVEDSKGEYILPNGNISDPPSINYQDVADLYHSLCPRLPKIKKITEERKKHIKARLNNSDLDELKEVFSKLGASDFCCGQNNRSWSADFDWVLKPNNWAKVLEGKYDNKPGGLKNNFESKKVPRAFESIREAMNE